jgi:uncharacterized protein
MGRAAVLGRVQEAAMTPEERELVEDLFDRLAKLENAPRDPEAEQVIRAGLRRSPNALYSLVQSVLVQDEALKRADARIRELGGEVAEDVHPKSFLDNMRDAIFGRDDRRGSVPSVRPGGDPRWGAGAGAGAGAPPQYDPRYAAPPAGVGPGAYPQGYTGGGHSFLGTAAAAAAGVIGGGLLLGGIRNMLGGGTNQGAFAGTFDQIADSPGAWSDASGSGLAREAGLDDIGGGRQAAFDDGGGDNQGFFDTAGNDVPDSGGLDDGGGFDGGSDTA